MAGAAVIDHGGEIVRWPDALGVDAPGGVYNPGVWRTTDGRLQALVRQEATFPCATPRAPLYIDGDPRFCGAEVHTTELVGWDGVRLEDFRPLRLGEVIYVVHTVVPGHVGVPGVRSGGIQPMLSVFVPQTRQLVRADDLVLPRLLAPVEKNWVLFEPRAGALGLVYSLDPLIIYAQADPGTRWRCLHAEVTDLTRAFGKPPRNSANLVPFDDGWLGWWHLQLDGVYVSGVYWLDATLRLVARSGILLDGSAVREGHKPGVRYVSSQAWSREQDVLTVYLGEADEWCAEVDVTAAFLRGVLR